jgi:hypothetical protein
MRGRRWRRLVGALWLVAGLALLFLGQLLFGVLGVIAGLAFMRKYSRPPR